MRTNEIKKLRMEVGKFLHDYFINFGEERYEKFLETLGEHMIKEYGEPFSGENLRIMEAEYVTLNATINEKNKHNIKKTTTKE